jgi:hypothetical protein
VPKAYDIFRACDGMERGKKKNEEMRSRKM